MTSKNNSLAKNVHLFFIAFCFLLPSLLPAQNLSKQYMDGEVYLKVKTAKVANITKGLSVNVTTDLPFLSKFSAQFPILKAQRSFHFSKNETLNSVYRIKLSDATQMKAFIEELSKDLSVEYVEQIPLMQHVYATNDPNYSSQWHLNTIKADLAWNIFKGNALQKTIIAVVDDAVQTDHPDLAANCMQGWDVADNDNDPRPPDLNYSHGTHVAGIAGGVTDNGVGISSLGFNGVKILPVKSTNSGAGITHAYEGLAYAANQSGVKIISMSWGGSGSSVTSQNIINDAYSRGILLIAAAGNASSNSPLYPASYDHVLSVASTGTGDVASSFTSYGTFVDIAAPGSSIYSSVPFGTYATYSGTSMATPLVSSLAAYLWSYVPNYTNAQIEALIKASADNIDAVNPSLVGQLGAGRINALRAIQMACPDNPGDVSLNVSGPLILCTGSTTTLSSRRINNVTYEWYKNGILQTGSDTSFTVTSGGTYQLKVTKNSCFSTSNTVVVEYFSTASPAPISTVDTTICFGNKMPLGKGLKAVPAFCNSGQSSTFTYSGASVGYDGGRSSGVNPSVTVSGVGSVKSIKMAVTFRKQDGINEYSCATPGAGCVWNSEIKFSLKSPSGTVRLVLNSGSFNSCVDAGLVTLIFKDTGGSLPLNGVPVNGLVLKPYTPLSALQNEVADGVWTLQPEDTGSGDPICVSGFALTFEDNETAISWWSAPTGGTLVGRGNIFTPQDTLTGTYKYYAEGLCPGKCPSSSRLMAQLNVSTITPPSVYAFDMNLGVTTQNVQMSNTTQGITIGGAYPIFPPVSICKGAGLLLASTGCGSITTKWNTGEAGVTLYRIFPSVKDTVIAVKTFCLNTANGCKSSYSPPLSIYVEPANLTVDSEILENRNGVYRAGHTVTGVSNIKSPTQIEFKAGDKIDFAPGFSTTIGGYFKTSIEGCPN